MWTLMLRSMANRRHTIALTTMVIAVAVSLFITVEVIRQQAKQSFTNTIAATDLVVGARSGDLNLLLYSVFHLGQPTSNVSWQSYQTVAALNGVKWTVPLMLGDSHRGYRVLGTNQDYFQYYRYGQQQPLQLQQGQRFDGLFEVVLGSEVASALGYRLGDNLALAHGTGSKTSFSTHDDMPFTVVGVLAPTGTPVDRTLHVSLEAISAIHLGWQGGVKAGHVALDQVTPAQLQPQAVSAMLVGLSSKFKLLSVQRYINNYRAEPLSAVLPGMALAQLWQLLSQAEAALLLLSGAVVMIGLIGMITTLLASLNERRREMAVLRAIGAAPRHIFLLLWGEAMLLATAGSVLGVVAAQGLMLLLAPWALQHYGLQLALIRPTPALLTLLALVLATAAIAALLPAWRAYRTTLADGLSQRL
ncbi:ABC transporter permease [uncultured Ferrimonas sp.]|uniref:ABC transporter permease n=1 Tax=uncultured Ferrimonas sp. TaxID=432640 RepID=UPI002601A506|nr:ABC transporter permease [uncultured Ferrimonas sp.]